MSAACLRTVLFVDDEQEVLSTLEEVLERELYTIRTATSPAAALRCFEDGPIAVVVSDQRMPGLSGTEFLAEVRRRSPDTIRIILTGHADVEAALAAINEGEVFRFITKPWDDGDLKRTLREALLHYALVEENQALQALTQAQNAELRGLNAGLEQRVAARTQDLEAKTEEVTRLYAALDESFQRTVRVFLGLIELNNPHLGGHSKRVGAACRALAAEFRLQPEEAKALELAGYLHDIGLLGIPQRLVREPFAALSPEEVRLVRQHPGLGQALLQPIPHLQAAGILIRHHHERFDGQGFPDGLDGEFIPFEGRILTVVDTYDELTHRGLASPVVLARAAQDHLKREAGAIYDPVVVEAFLAWLARTRRPGWREVAVLVADLRPGGVLARNVFTRSGRLVMARDTALQASFVERLRNFMHVDPVVEPLYVYEAPPGA
jgi:response regulator RpfG family c-di-GMP phosphodiesterase